MKEFFKNLWKDYITSAVATVVAGVLIMLFYGITLDLICIILGAIGVLIGVVSIARFLKSPDPISRFGLLVGLILGGIGIYIICNPESFQSLLAIVFGTVILCHGIVDLQNAIKMYNGKYKFWYVALIISLLTLGAGITLIALNTKAFELLARAIGIIFIAEGLLDLWIAIKVKKVND